MAEYSRTKKYQDLRNSLQSDTGTDSIPATKELSRFANRLNQIDSNNFSAPKEYNDNYEGSHVRSTLSRITSAEPMETEVKNDVEEDNDSNSFFHSGSYQRSEEFSPSFDNDYLDQYIREVKEYNIAQGNAVSENTTVNVLHNLQKNTKEEEGTPAPRKPYSSTNSTVKNKQQVPYSSNTPEVQKSFEDTADIPFITPKKYSSSSNSSSYYDSEPVSSDSQSRTKEDIMAEVQSMVNGKVSEQPVSSRPAPVRPSYDQDSFARMSYDTDRTTRQQLLNETTQMRAQLDDYEDNLSEVTDKMRRTNSILNIVLIVLIISLIVILGIVIYIITQS